MKEIILTKTFRIEDQEDKTSLESKLYDSLYNELLLFNSLYVQVKVEEIPKWLELTPSTSNLEAELNKKVHGYFRTYSVDMKPYYISCKNYTSLQTHFSRVKVIYDSVQNKYVFVLFFNSLSQFFVNVIGSELLVSPVSNTGDIYHVDMADGSISILQMSNLLSH
jgi:hypothetical protein